MKLTDGQLMHYKLSDEIIKNLSLQEIYECIYYCKTKIAVDKSALSTNTYPHGSSGYERRVKRIEFGNHNIGLLESAERNHPDYIQRQKIAKQEAAKQREKWANNASQNLCINCGQVKMTKFSDKCKKCKYPSIYQSAKWRRKGKCAFCGRKFTGIGMVCNYECSGCKGEYRYDDFSRIYDEFYKDYYFSLPPVKTGESPFYRFFSNDAKLVFMSMFLLVGIASVFTIFNEGIMVAVFNLIPFAGLLFSWRVPSKVIAYVLAIGWNLILLSILYDDIHNFNVLIVVVCNSISYLIVSYYESRFRNIGIVVFSLIALLAVGIAFLNASEWLPFITLIFN